MNFIKNNFQLFVIIILIGLLLIRNCSSSVTPVRIVTHDTVTVSKPIIVKGEVIHDTVKVSKRIPYVVTKTDSIEVDRMGYDSLKQKYISLLTDFNSTLYFKDVINVDTFGTVTIMDSVNQNKIFGRHLRFEVTLPNTISTVTTIVFPEPKNQWFIGVNLKGNKVNPIKEIDADILLITKKNKGYTVGTGIDINGTLNFKAGLKWKL